VILYEMLTGRTPFLGASILDTLQQVRNQEPVPPSHLQPKVPCDLETICLKCLQKDPHKRYETAEALAEDVHRFRVGEPIRARRVGRVERAWRWCKRNPRIAALSAAVAALMMVSVVALTGMQLRAWRDREASLATRKMAQQRLEQAREAMEAGEFRRAQDLLRWSDALLEQSPSLADVRAELGLYRDQVNLYTQFKDLLDQARYYGLSDSPELLKEAQQHCRQFLQLNDEIENHTGRGACGLPRFTAEQQEMFYEDLFEGFLVAGKVDWDETTARQDRPAQIEAARQAVARYDRIEKLLPPTKTLHSRRFAFWTMLSRLDPDAAAREAAAKAAEQDRQRAAEITASSPIDRFWHGFAEQLRGNTQARQGNGPRAREFFQSAIGEYVALLHLRPGHFWAYYYYALAHYQRREFHDAIVGYTACIHISPERPWPYYQRGLAYHQLQQYDLALQDFELALARHDRDADVYGSRGETHLAMGDKAAGLADLDQAVKLRPTQLDVYLRRGKAYHDLGRYDEAIADFERALRLHPKSPDVLYHRGLTYQAQRKPELALADFDAAIAADAGYLLAAYQKITTHCGLLQYEQALAETARILKLKSDDLRAHTFAAHIYHRQGRYDDAIKLLNVVLQRIAPSNPSILNQRGDVYRSMGKLDLAVADWRRSVQLAGKQIDGYLGLAATSHEQGKKQETDEWLARMIAADPQSAAPYLRRAEALRSRGQLDAAAADCDKAAELDPQSVHDDLVRAGIDALRGNPEQAAKAAEALLATAPDDDGQAVFSAVCTLVLAAEATGRGGDKSEPDDEQKRYLNRAAELLADLLGPGPYRMTQQEYSRWVSDGTLDPIRSHPLVENFLAAGSRRE
jgi:tetratricopeptide (TPR) repeat protein